MNVFDAVGYTALVINLYSMYTKGELKLRTLSFMANGIYILYGVLIHAMPIIIGCTIAVGLHGYRIYQLKKEENTAT